MEYKIFNETQKEDEILLKLKQYASGAVGIVSVDSNGDTMDSLVWLDTHGLVHLPSGVDDYFPTDPYGRLKVIKE